jgi:hypothetical protein
MAVGKYALNVVCILAWASALLAQPTRAIVPSDCVSIRDLLHDDVSWHSSIQISPDGRHIAYPVRAPNLATNENDIEVYVQSWPPGKDADQTKGPILSGTGISQLQWRPDGRHLVYLMVHNGAASINEIDVESKALTRLVVLNPNAREFSISKNGDAIVYGVDVAGKERMRGPSADESARGYRIPFEEEGGTVWPERQLFAMHRLRRGWSSPELLVIKSPLSGAPMNALTYLPNSGLDIALSPSGRFLLFEYLETTGTMPEEWRASGYKKLVSNSSRTDAFYLTVLYDLATHKSSLPLKSPFVLSAPVWSQDGKSFTVAGQPLIGSSMEADQMKDSSLGHSSGSHLFWVEPATGSVEVVASQLAYPWEGALYWKDNNEMLVRVSKIGNATRLVREGNQWQPVASYEIPLERSSELATDGHSFVSGHSDFRTPPELFEGTLGSQETHVFAKFNPQFGHLKIAESRELHWKTSTGFDVDGILLIPPDYIEGTRYPLVIQTKPYSRGFGCSLGDSPSFAPQPTADAGILYLGMIPPPFDSPQTQETYYPKGYPGFQGPGGVAEAAFNMDIWDSAIAMLDARGIIDRSRVGIIGFSRTGWYTEFILSHSATHYRAATIADNVEYSLGEYWLRHDGPTLRSWDSMYGGPPYGETLSNWIKYSISFDLDRIHTPVLMEEMGNKQPAFTDPLAPPRLLAEKFELFTGLNRLHRPVEFYYYPNEDHSPDHPLARLSTLQRNLDWYRFWLQGHEDPAQDDPGRYARWRDLLKLQKESDRSEGIAAPPSGTAQ